MKRVLCGGAVFNSVLVLLTILFIFMDRNTLIITMGIIGANYFLIGGRVVIGIVLVAGNTVFIRKVVRIKRQQVLTKPAMPMKHTPNESIDPERIREEFKLFYEQRPALQTQIDSALAQMDSMDRKQAKLQRIFERNHVTSLNEVATTVDDAEQVLCRNMEKLINRIILWDPLEWNKPGKEQIYAEHLSYIQKLLNHGDELLSKCDKLLSETVIYMDEKYSGDDNGQLHLDAMTETIQTLRKISDLEL